MRSLLPLRSVAQIQQLSLDTGQTAITSLLIDPPAKLRRPASGKRAWEIGHRHKVKPVHEVVQEADGCRRRSRPPAAGNADLLDLKRDFVIHPASPGVLDNRH